MNLKKKLEYQHIFIFHQKINQIQFKWHHFKILNLAFEIEFAQNYR